MQGPGRTPLDAPSGWLNAPQPAVEVRDLPGTGDTVDQRRE